MKFETIAIHGGYEPDPTTKSVAVPIYQTTSYAFDNSQHGADLFDLKVPGNIYTRIMNPTNTVLEQRMAALEGGSAGLCFSSGMAAITAAVFTLARAGDHIISTNQLYGGTYNLFAHTLPSMGINVKFASADDLAGMASMIDDRTRMIYCESMGNPSGIVCDMEQLAQIAHDKGVPLVVDNTVPTPALWKPITHGADIIIHSLTKYIGGHGTTLGGMVIDSGRFPWAAHADRFPVLTQPDPSYHGICYTEAMGDQAFIGRCRVVSLRNMGAALSPFNAFLLLQGLETLSLRMERHSSNALKVAEYLRDHRRVSWVQYAGLADSAYYPLVERYMNGQASGLVSFGVKGGAEAGMRFIDALQVIVRLVNIGDAKSLACHPASTTHRQLNEDELRASGVSQDLVRLSIGIEHMDDILADIEQALMTSG